MVFYHVVSTYQLLCAIIHSSKQDSPCTLLVAQWAVEKFPQILTLHNYFSRILQYDAGYATNHTIEESDRYLDQILGDLTCYKEIYIWAAHHAFGAYIVRKGLPFIFCEDAAGLLSRPHILKLIGEKDNQALHENNLRFGLYTGQANNCQLCLCNIKAQTDDFKASNSILDFDVVHELCQLSSIEQKQIISIFLQNISGLDVPCGGTLILTQHFSNLRQLSFEDHCLIYQMLVDYFFPERKLIIKTHPDDRMYYQKLFPDANLIRTQFPAEFLPFIINTQLDCVATISSTAIFNLRGHYPQVFELDDSYEHDFKMTHRYYVALMIAKQLNMTVVCLNTNESLARQLCLMLGIRICKSNQIQISPSKPRMFLVDSSSFDSPARMTAISNLIHSSNRDCFVFLNPDDFLLHWYSQNKSCDRIIPIVLSKNRIPTNEEVFFASLEEEVFYIYAADKETLNMAKQITVEKALPHVGIKLTTMPLSPEQERIKVLEGILAATEKRLLYYIEKEKEDRKEDL